MSPNASLTRDEPGMAIGWVTVKRFCLGEVCETPVETEVTLPYLPGNTFYRLALRPLMGPVDIPELTTVLEIPKCGTDLGPHQ